MHILLETTAGQGSNLGFRFEHLQEIIRALNFSRRIGVCFDTCHVFAAGYELRSAEGLLKTLAEFDWLIGLERIKAFHLNDSRRAIGERVDRHHRLGQGNIGIELFRMLSRDSRFSEIPAFLEIPGGEAAFRQDIEILKQARDQ